MPIVSNYIIRRLVHVYSNGPSTGKQAFNGQEVPQRGAEIRWIVQCEGPLSRESPTPSVLQLFPWYQGRAYLLFLPLNSTS